MFIEQRDNGYRVQGRSGSDNFHSGLSIGNLFRSGVTSIKEKIAEAQLDNKPVQIICGDSKITTKQLNDIEVLPGKHKLIARYIGMDNRPASQEIQAKNPNLKLRIIATQTSAQAAEPSQASPTPNSLHAAPVIVEESKTFNSAAGGQKAQEVSDYLTACKGKSLLITNQGKEVLAIESLAGVHYDRATSLHNITLTDKYGVKSIIDWGAIGQVKVKLSSIEEIAQTKQTKAEEKSKTETKEKLETVINKDHQLPFMSGLEWDDRLDTLINNANEVLKGKTINLSYKRLQRENTQNYTFNFDHASRAGANLIINNDQGQEAFSCERHLGVLRFSLAEETKSST